MTPSPNGRSSLTLRGARSLLLAAAFAFAAALAQAAGVAPAAGGYVDLSQDGTSGAGFYPLPPKVRAEAKRGRAAQYAADRAAIGTAIESEAIGYDYDEGYAFGNGHGVFDPVDGVGTPFFAGFYH